jgi:RNA polymerase primary sigma factor
MRQLTITQQITNRESLSLDKYFQDISKVDLISSEVEVELAKRIREGDQVALERLTKANLRFVVSVAKQYQNFGLTLGDLINEGNLGLIKAAQRFDETRGFKFISYAVWWIRQSIMQSLAEQSRMVRLPLNRVSSLNKISKTFADLEQKYQREPSVQEVADAIGTTFEDVSNNQSVSGRHVSFSAPFQQNEDNNLLDLLVDTSAEMPDAELLEDSLKTEIKRALGTLTVREQQVMILSFGLNDNSAMTLDEIGDRFNLSRERVRQIKEKATKRLRHLSNRNTLRNFAR